MKKRITTLLLFVTIICAAQTKVELNVEKENDSELYKLRLEQTINGEVVVTEKCYNSLEEMKNDPNVKDLNLHFMDSEEQGFSFDNDGNTEVHMKVLKEMKEGDHKVMIFKDDEGEDENVKVWQDKEGNTHVLKNGEKVAVDLMHKEGHNSFVFKMDGEEGDIHEERIKIWIDEDGQHHVEVNGKEVDYEEWKKENGNELHISSEPGEDGKHIRREIIIHKGDEDVDTQHMKMLVEKSGHIMIHVEELNTEDAKTFSLEKSKELKLDEFNFYPNPSHGAFQLQFKGKNKPTEIRVTNINGKEIYSESLSEFSGTYDKEVDLSGVEKGIYLLQVVQSGKVVNKKIVVE